GAGGEQAGEEARAADLADEAEGDDEPRVVAGDLGVAHHEAPDAIAERGRGHPRDGRAAVVADHRAALDAERLDDREERVAMIAERQRALGAALRVARARKI